MSPDQLRFFRSRFIDASTGTRFVFINKTTSSFYQDCVELLAGNEDTFVEISKRLTFSFNSFHRSNANDGIFIVSKVSIEVDDENCDLIFLIKMDHRAVLRYKLENNEATFEEILNTVVEEKNAMQKVAIIDLEENFDWDVLAYERARTDTVANYFQDFLTVQEKEPASTLTRRCVRVTKKWARKNRTSLPERLTPEDYRDRAADYMHGNQEYDSANFVDFIIGDELDHLQDRNLKDDFREFLINEGLYGITFRPRPNSIRTKENRNDLKTREGVRIEWYGTKESKNIEVPVRPDEEDNLYHITIKTTEIIQNENL